MHYFILLAIISTTNKRFCDVNRIKNRKVEDVQLSSLILTVAVFTAVLVADSSVIGSQVL